MQCDLLNMPAVSQLEKDENQLVYELLKIFLTKRLDSYLEFYSANSALLKDHGTFSARPVPMLFPLANSNILYTWLHFFDF